MYSNWDGLLGVPITFALIAGVARRATWVPENAKKRKRVVPANSALVATKWLRACSYQYNSFRTHLGLLAVVLLTSSGIQLRKGRRFDFKEDGREFVRRTLLSLKKGRTKPPPCMGSLIFFLSLAKTSYVSLVSNIKEEPKEKEIYGLRELPCER